MVCVPALPPIEATMGISTASATISLDGGIEQADDERGEDGGHEVDHQPGDAAAHGAADAVGDLFVADAGEALHVLGRLLRG